MREKKELAAGVILSLAASFMLFFYAPLELYFNNVFEFWFDIGTLFPVVLFMFVAAAFVGIVISVALYHINIKSYRIWILLSFVMYVALYIQGNFLVANLPVLDGTAVDWSRYSSERILSIAVWFIVAAVFVFVYMKFRHSFFENMVKLVSVCMSLMLLITLVSVCLTKNGMMKKNNYCVTYKNITQMSKDTNFIILMFDTIDAGKFSEMLNEHPEYNDIFEDFTYFDNAMATYPFTEYSVPFILSGKWFENEREYTDYIDDVYSNSEFLNGMISQDYKVDIYSGDLPLNVDFLGKFDNVIAKNGKISTPGAFILDQMKLVGLRYAPFDLKRFCIFDTNDFWSMRQIEGMEILFNFGDSNKKFYDILQNDEIKLINDKCFKFIHLEGGHVPYRYDKNMNILEKMDVTYEGNVEACVKIADTYIQKLKETGVYDNSIIIIMSDHGYDESYEGWKSRQDALFMVKGLGEKHDMSISSAPVSYEDLTTAYERLMAGRESDNIFDYKENDVRERRFLWYALDEEELMIEYVQTGFAGDEETMIPTGRIFEY